KCGFRKHKTQRVVGQCFWDCFAGRRTDPDRTWCFGMIAYRLSRTEYARDLSGRGAELAGGRWNSKGTALVYTGQTIALCMAEVAVHIPLGIIPLDYELVTLEIPDS